MNVIERNRNNSLKSTGPVTEAGKAAMRHNAIRWGMCARHHVVPGEDKAEFDALHASLKDEWKPVTPRAIELVLNLTGAKWKQLRARRIEDELFSAAVDLHSSTCLGDAFREIGPDLDRLRRYETTAIRVAEKIEAELTRLAAERDAHENANTVSFDEMLNGYLLAPLPGSGLQDGEHEQAATPLQNPAREQAAIEDNSGFVSQNSRAEADSDLPTFRSPDLPPSGCVSQNPVARTLARLGTLPPDWEVAYLNAA